MNYYNEWDSFAAEWLKQLIKDGLIPDGEVDTRSIADVEPSDLNGFTQCHFFAGIGGWSRALQLAGWSSDRPVWTGSPPCQSFSTAGKGKGKDDERHLWPVFFNLIRECQPTAVFGEQVAAAIRHGWLDDLQIDFEEEGYASAAVVLPAGGVGAFHKRDRLFFTAKRVADPNDIGHERNTETRREAQRGTEHAGSLGVANTDEFGQSRPGEVQRRFGTEKDSQREVNRAVNVSRVSTSLANTNSSQLQGRGIPGGVDQKDSATRGDEAFSLWGNSQIIYCRDGKYRPIPTEPALFPLANGIPNRVGILRGAGNAIVPQAAAEIIKAVM
jgi:DNA (cytosine-5)-methyltransferase 1